MSKKDKKDKDTIKSSKRKIRVYVTILIIVVIFGGVLYLAWTNKDDKEKNKVVILDSLSEYGYTLSDNDSELFKEEFNKLKTLLNSGEFDNKEYSECVAKLFVIDVYSLNTKMNIYDLGGIEYYYSDKKTMFEKKLIDTIYASLEDNTYDDREQELPEVKSVTIDSVEEVEYEMIKKVNDKEEKNKLNGYKIRLSWEYEEDLGYDSEAEVIIVPDGNIRYSVVDFNTKIEKTKEKNAND